MKTYTVIKTGKQYKQYLKRLEEIFHAKEGTKEGDELDLLAVLIEDYENKHYPIADPDPIEAIKFMMQQNDLKLKDLVELIGENMGNISKVLNKKRKLSLEMIRKLNAKLHIPTEVLVKDYKLISKNF